MSTIKTTNLSHGSNSGTANLALASTGNVTVGADLIATKQNGCQRIVLEEFASPCDGSTIATANGDVTFPNVTATVDTTSTYADVAGSIITYNPPTGTTCVIYAFNFQFGPADTHAITHWKAFIAGQEIAYQRFNVSANNLLEMGAVNYKWVIPVGGTTSTDTGRLATWTSGKELKLQVRSYSGTSYDAHLYGTNYWEGAGGNTFRQPNIHIKALG